MKECPCCSGKSYSDCCKPYHDGLLAPNPLALMRSRYSAYALGQADYIMRTTHPKSPYYEKKRAKWKMGILTFCEQMKFIRLEIVSSGENWVHFIAYLDKTVLNEKSYFEFLDGKWLYLKGEFIK